jgi:hypothetical protein
VASGCIQGTCPICDEFIWEDEEVAWDEDDVFYHKECLDGVNKVQRIETGDTIVLVFRKRKRSM